MVDGFIYMQVSREDNFIICVSHIFTSSMTRSRNDNDEDAVDCIRFSTLACFSMNNTEQDYLIATVILFIIYYLLFITYYLLFIIYYLLFIIYCSWNASSTILSKVYAINRIKNNFKTNYYLLNLYFILKFFF